MLGLGSTDGMVSSALLRQTLWLNTAERQLPASLRINSQYVPKSS